MKIQFNILKKSVQFLVSKNTKNLEHKKSSFFEHLVGTYNLLLFWNQNFNLCMAGLFHNIYGNQYYDPKLNIKREEIQKLIGIKAEEIVWNFVNAKRNKIVELNIFFCSIISFKDLGYSFSTLNNSSRTRLSVFGCKPPLLSFCTESFDKEQ